MSTTVYIVTSLVWAFGGFLFGYLLGRAARTLQRIDRKVGMDDEAADPATPTDNPAPSSEPGRSRTERVFGVVLIGLAVLSVIGVGIQTVRLGNATSCQAEFNEHYTAALKLRTKAAATERAAQRELLTLMLQQPTQQEARAALQRYIDGLAKADREREDAQIPTRACD